MQPTGFVTSADGTGIAVYDSAAPAAQATVLAVHGYPDNARVWDAVAASLEPQFRVLRYDVRGTGRSDRPRARTAYRYSRLLEDVRAVLDGYSPDEPVHLLGHDWGSVQGWYFVAELAERFASFTSISGPNVAYLQPWIRSKLSAGNAGPVLRQLTHSSYIAFFQTPVLPELLWRSGALDRVLARQEPHMPRALPDKLNGLQLYRANLMTREALRPKPVRVPVQVLAPTADSFIGVDVATESPRPFVESLEIHTVDAGHWLPLTHPDYVAERMADYIRRTHTD